MSEVNYEWSERSERCSIFIWNGANVMSGMLGQIERVKGQRIQITIVLVIIFSRYWSKSIIRRFNLYQDMSAITSNITARRDAASCGPGHWHMGPKGPSQLRWLVPVGRAIEHIGPAERSNEVNERTQRAVLTRAYDTVLYQSFGTTCASCR